MSELRVTVPAWVFEALYRLVFSLPRPYQRGESKSVWYTRVLVGSEYFTRTRRKKMFTMTTTSRTTKLLTFGKIKELQIGTPR